MPVGQLFSLNVVDGRKVVLLYGQLHDVVYPTTFSRRNIISKAQRYRSRLRVKALVVLFDGVLTSLVLTDVRMMFRGH